MVAAPETWQRWAEGTIQAGNKAQDGRTKEIGPACGVCGGLGCGAPTGSERLEVLGARFQAETVPHPPHSFVWNSLVSVKPLRALTLGVALYQHQHYWRDAIFPTLIFPAPAQECASYAGLDLSAGILEFVTEARGTLVRGRRGGTSEGTVVKQSQAVTARCGRGYLRAGIRGSI